MTEREAIQVRRFLQPVKASREGAFRTQEARASQIRAIARDLYSLGYRNLKPKNVTRKHAAHLLETWVRSGVAPSTIKNNMYHLRWLKRHVGGKALPARNDQFLDHCGNQIVIPERRYVAAPDRSNPAHLTDPGVSDALTRLEAYGTSDQWEISRGKAVALAVRAAALLGLRKETVLKTNFNVAYQPDRMNAIFFQPAHMKGRRPHALPLSSLSPEAIELLDELKTLCSNRHNSLGKIIARGGSFKVALDYTNDVLSTVGFTHAKLGSIHDYRHGYAVRRYREITGFDCPAVSGISVKERSKSIGDAKTRDTEARDIISSELAHNRRHIAAAYIGSAR